MTKLPQKVAAIAASSLLLLGIGAGTASAAVPDNRNNTGDAHFRSYSGNKVAFTVCESLDSLRNAPPHCSPHYGIRTLRPGQTTASWWPDADAIKIGRGYEWRVSNGGSTAWKKGAGSGASAKTFKITGCLNIGVKTCTKTVQVRRVR
jgi:hypothetical protein